MRTVKLYGHLGKQFGRTHKLDVASPAEAVRAMCANFPYFAQAMTDHAPGYHVHIGNEIASPDMLPFQSNDAIKFVPVVAGAKSGLGQVIFGAVLVAAAFATGGASLVSTGLFGFGTALETTMIGSLALSMGASMILGGISAALIGAPKTGGAANGPNNMPNYAFNGAVNTVAQGNSVPVCYGRLIVGSQVVSATLTVEQTTGRVITQPAIGQIT
jgi:predicted phage tail protein